MIFIWERRSELVDDISAIRAECTSTSYPTEFRTYEEAWEGLFTSIKNLEEKLNGLADQVLDMSKQAKIHFDGGETKLGSWLMQDIQQVILGRKPFAYPEVIYRWKR